MLCKAHFVTHKKKYQESYLLCRSYSCVFKTRINDSFQPYFFSLVFLHSDRTTYSYLGTSSRCCHARRLQHRHGGCCCTCRRSRCSGQQEIFSQKVWRSGQNETHPGCHQKEANQFPSQEDLGTQIPIDDIE